MHHLFEQCWDLNTGLCACQTRILRTEPHPQSTNLFCVVNPFTLFDKKGIISGQTVSANQRTGLSSRNSIDLVILCHSCQNKLGVWQQGWRSGIASFCFAQCHLLTGTGCWFLGEQTLRQNSGTGCLLQRVLGSSPVNSRMPRQDAGCMQEEAKMWCRLEDGLGPPPDLLTQEYSVTGGGLPGWVSSARWPRDWQQGQWALNLMCAAVSSP